MCELKAIKNECELRGLQKAHLCDAVALTEFFMWLEGEIAKVSLWCVLRLRLLYFFLRCDVVANTQEEMSASR